MVNWRDPGNAKKDVADFEPISSPPGHVAPTPGAATPAYGNAPANKESVIASDLSIEGKIEGAGHVRIAGKFKGDVNVKGDLTIDQGARLNGSVRAERVALAGELEGNIDQASRVELMANCTMSGDIKADTLTVAAGARVRGHVECGNWSDAKAAPAAATARATPAPAATPTSGEGSTVA